MIKSIQPSQLKGSLLIPPSKSHSIRAIIIGSFAEGVSKVYNYLDSADVHSCIKACRSLGAEIQIQNDHLRIKGTEGKIKAPENMIDVGNSGTTLYLITSIAALGDSPIAFTGDHQIQNRSASNLLNTLSTLGVIIKSTNKGYAPYTIEGPMKGGSIEISCPTSQYLSSLLLAAPLAKKDTEINVTQLNEIPYVDMTLQWLDNQKISYTNENYGRFSIPGNQKYCAFTKQIGGDFSSATFFLCAAAITQCELILHGLDLKDSQGDKAVLQYLRKLGCEIEEHTDFVKIQGKPMTGCILDLNSTPDALPALAATACFAEGETRLINVAHAREKETDRISIMTQELTKMGAQVEELADGLIIKKSNLKGTKVHGHHDHRIVMSLAIAALKATGPTTIDTAEAVNITFPQFFTILEKLKV